MLSLDDFYALINNIDIDDFGSFHLTAKDNGIVIASNYSDDFIFCLGALMGTGDSILYISNDGVLSFGCSYEDYSYCHLARNCISTSKRISILDECNNRKLISNFPSVSFNLFEGGCYHSSGLLFKLDTLESSLSGWKPISSAPKDSIRFLAKNLNGDVFIGKYKYGVFYPDSSNLFRDMNPVLFLDLPK